MGFRICQNGIPFRFIMALLLFFATVLSYMIRGNINLTIVAMVNKTALDFLTDGNETFYDDGSCSVNHNDTDDFRTVLKEGQHVWNHKVQGLVMGGFFYGYCSTMLIAGRLAEQFGTKWLLGGGMFLGSLCTLLIPLAANNIGYGAVVTLMVLTGMSQSILYPGMSALFPKWVPPSERTRLYAFSSSGAYVGSIFSMPLVGWLCNNGFAGGWPSVFYVIGMCGILWTIIWMLLSANSAMEHPRISAEEKKYILDSLPPLSNKKQKIPWKYLLTSWRVWAFVFALGSSSWMNYASLTELPNFLDQVLHVDIQQNGLFMALISTFGFVISVAGGFAADFILNRKYLSVTNTRKLIECIALIGSTGCVMALTWTGCDITVAMCWLALASCLQGLTCSADNILAMDMAPNFAGTLLGLGNTFYALSGFLAPLVTGFILSFEDISMPLRWNYVFYVACAISIAGSLITVLGWSAEVQPWNENPDDEEEVLVPRKKSNGIN